MGKELAPETSENLHIPVRLFARENLIEFFRRKRFKTYKGQFQFTIYIQQNTTYIYGHPTNII
jgi:hypothetical protein